MLHTAVSNSIQLNLSWIDYLMLAIYFAVVMGIGFIARSRVKSSMDFFLSGRSMPAWITGLAFVSANLGATEILGMAANGAQIGMATLHYYLIGAVPAMVFLGLVLMPFYYGSTVRDRDRGDALRRDHLLRDRGCSRPYHQYLHDAQSIEDLKGLVYGVGKIDLTSDVVAGDTAWYRSPALLGTAALVLCVVLYLPFL